MSRTRFRGRGTAVAAGAAALALLISGCGGTRVSDEAIQAAAGVGVDAPVSQGPGGVATDTAVPGTVPGDTLSPALADPNVPPVAGAEGKTPQVAPRSGPGADKPVKGKDKVGVAAPSAPAPSAPAPSAGGPDKPVAPSGAVATGPATKSVIKLGVTGTFGGPVGGLVKDTVAGIRVWGQHINDNGGVNGHPVEILVGDDGGDPARFIAIQRQFVEEEGVVAFLYATLGFSPNGNNKYLDSKKIFTFGTEGGLETAYSNPYVMTATPTGFTNADSIIYALSKVAQPQNKKKFAAFACSDFGLCDNFDKRWTEPKNLQATGFELTVRGRPSLTQPDYTSQCLSAKQSASEVVMLALDTASLRRFAGDCARQGFKPIFGTADLLALSSLPSDPNVDGLIVATKMAPWVDTSVPGIAEMTKAFAKYAPGVTPSGGNSNGWILGEFFAAAGANFGDTVTPAEVEAGIYRIKNNNLNGMTYPITMTKGQPVKRQLCYGAVIIKDKRYQRIPGPSLYCQKADDPTAAVTNSSATSSSVAADFAPVSYAAPQRAAITATASNSWLAPVPVPAAIAVPTALPVRAPRSANPATETATATGPATPRSPAAAASCDPARAVGFSHALDAVQAGTAVGPGISYGAALAALGTPLPEPFGAAQGQFLAQSGGAVEQFSDDVPAAIQDSRQQFESVAVYNDYGNAFIDAVADSLDTVATEFGPFIQPGDSSLRQVADVARDAKAANTTCTPQSVPSGDKVVDALALAFAKGQVTKAKAIIAKNNLVTDADRLGQAVFFGGIASTEANTFDEFRTAVAGSFVEGGVSPIDAGRAFQAAATKAVTDGITFEQGAVGFRTVTETYAAYFAEAAGR
ncbi:MAG: ABC transporter substrate-binding protein [Sporichthyaceae bacterium]